MVSYKNYLTMTVVMLVVFFLFQFTNVMLEGWDGYEENTYARDRESLPGQESVYEPGQGSGEELRESVVYIGSGNPSLKEVVQNWVYYSKRELKAYASLEEYAQAGEDQLPRLLVLDAAHMDWEGASVSGQLEEYANQGMGLVFCNLPQVSVLKENRELRKLLGIEDIRAEEMTMKGLHLYEGFLLGGEMVYQSENEEEEAKRQDMELTFPWFSLSSEAQVYLSGLPAQEVKVEERPPVIWSNAVGTGQVFAVNGGYMEDAAGLGLLSAMCGQTGNYELYPVVNAQNMVILNCPGLAAENQERMEARYGQSMPEMFREVVWPMIVSAYRRSTLGLSCMVAPQYDYEDEALPREEELEYYMKRLKEQSAEAGLTGDSISDTPIEEKLKEDDRFVRSLLPDYKFTSFYRGSLTEEELDFALETDMLKSVRSVVEEFDGSSEVIGYRSGHVVRQYILSDGVVHTYREDFRMRCLETALGYTSVGMDMSSAAYPQDSQEDMDRMISDFGWNVRTYWKNFGVFSGTTLSESDQRIRNFLALDFHSRREGDTVYLELDKGEAPAWFVLRTGGERISRMEGGSWKLMEEGAYLIEAEDTQVKIELQAGKRKD